MRIDILSIFPEFFESPLSVGIIKRAQNKGKVLIEVHNLRDYAKKKGYHQQVDDYPYGGGPGMVLKVEPIYYAVEAITKKYGRPYSILLSPDGELFTQYKANQLAKREHILLICGHYEGIDERASELCADTEISIGDYILSGGEAAALVIIDAITRLIPGVLGNKESIRNGPYLLDYPQYTRPREFFNLRVPEVLLSGNHKEIAKWRRKEALKRTLKRRPELIDLALKESYCLSQKEIDSLISEVKAI
jgi:tRNA (guanine37-N1)-methyltransferase